MTPTPGQPPRATLDGWAVRSFTGAGLTYDCYEKGSGPGVVLIPEIPGISPEVLGLADHLVHEGFTVVVPSPFGTPGREATTGYTIGTVVRLCVSAEFRAFALDAQRPITSYFRAVAADLASRTGGGVGVIGMCFTGGFALATAVEPTVLASVVSQPAVPFPISGRRRSDPGLSLAELETVRQNNLGTGVCAIGLRFSEDGSAPAARFAAIKERLGDAFEVIQLDSSRGNADEFGPGAHSVLTHELREDPPNAAFAARVRVVAFLRERLGASARQ